jgi:SAM-dependent methyltransferase
MKRATELAKEQGVTNAEFLVMDALDMQFPDNSFDYVWACESGEHMPDKKRYIEEMTRVLKPGGKIVVATWCQRDEGNKPFSNDVSRCSMILGGNALNSMHIHLYIFRRRECLISCIPSGRTLSSSPSAITRS